MLLAAACLAGCAAEVKQRPAQFILAEAPRWIVLTQTVVAQPEAGHSRRLDANSRFQLVGRVGQGQVFKPYDDAVFTLLGSHQYEAWLVLHESSLVGFYLPSERSFSPIVAPVPFPHQPFRE